jgi:uncharacterized protein
MLKKRVAVVGLSGSGKTVFLTSLINHLDDYDDKCLRNTTGEVEMFLAKKVKGPCFKYEAHRQCLVEGHVWPFKTVSASKYRCQFQLSHTENKNNTGNKKKSIKKVDLELCDIPGERLADMLMAKLSYNDWSDEMLKLLRYRSEYKDQAAKYVDLVDAKSASRGELLVEYKRCLAKLLLTYTNFVTPSTFWVSPDGKYPEIPEGVPDREQYLVDHCCCGLATGNEFAPLSQEFLGKNPLIAKAFSKAYKQYKSKIVTPIQRWLSESNVLLLLVDIPGVFESGLGKYECNRKIMENVIKAANPGTSRTGRILRWPLRKVTLGLRGYAIERTAFIASKSDLVLRDDRTKMVGLLKDMARKFVKGIEGLEVKYFECSSVDSTEERDNGGLLEGHRMNKDEEGISKFKPSEIPAGWPPSWKAGEYTFPKVYPKMPERTDEPPKHIGLNHIFDFIMKQ